MFRENTPDGTLYKIVVYRDVDENNFKNVKSSHVI